MEMSNSNCHDNAVHDASQFQGCSVRRSVQVCGFQDVAQYDNKTLYADIDKPDVVITILIGNNSIHVLSVLKY